MEEKELKERIYTIWNEKGEEIQVFGDRMEKSSYGGDITVYEKGAMVAYVANALTAVASDVDDYDDEEHNESVAEYLNRMLPNIKYENIDDCEKETMNETLKSQITEHCQMVARGVKPLSLLAHQERYYDEIIKIIKENNLYYSSEIISVGWRAIYIYKNKAVRFLIPELPQEPTKPIEHALLGLLLGYDINSICDYFLDECELDEPNLI